MLSAFIYKAPCQVHCMYGVIESSKQHSETGYRIIIPILQMKRLRLRFINMLKRGREGDRKEWKGRREEGGGKEGTNKRTNGGRNK